VKKLIILSLLSAILVGSFIVFGAAEAQVNLSDGAKLPPGTQIVQNEPQTIYTKMSLCLDELMALGLSRASQYIRVTDPKADFDVRVCKLRHAVQSSDPQSAYYELIHLNASEKMKLIEVLAQPDWGSNPSGNDFESGARPESGAVIEEVCTPFLKAFSRYQVWVVSEKEFFNVRMPKSFCYAPSDLVDWVSALGYEPGVAA
jgi:hypothetical protein